MKYFKIFSLYLVGLTLTIRVSTRLATASIEVPFLSDSQRSSLRHHLENLYNEFDLLIRNKKVDEADLVKQGRTVTALKIYERIPFSPKLKELEKEIRLSAKKAKIQLQPFQLRESSHRPLIPMPKTLTFQDGYFRPKVSQLVQEHPFQLHVSGPLHEIEAWTRSWKENLMRLVELERVEAIQRVTTKNHSSSEYYVIRAQTFQFKKTEFPKIIPPQAADYLPQWAIKNPESFSRQEPILWDLVVRSEKIRPAALPLYPTRGKFLLEGARIDFFLSKATP